MAVVRVKMERIYWTNQHLVMLEQHYEITRNRSPGIAWTWVEEWPLATRVKCANMTPTTRVIDVVQIRKTSLYLSSLVGANSNMKA